MSEMRACVTQLATAGRSHHGHYVVSCVFVLFPFHQMSWGNLFSITPPTPKTRDEQLRKLEITHPDLKRCSVKIQQRDVSSILLVGERV